MIFQNGHVDITLVVGKQPSPHRWGKRPEDVVHKSTAGSRNWQGEFWINTINGYFGCKFAGAQFCGEKVHPLKINMLNTKMMVFFRWVSNFQKGDFQVPADHFPGWERSSELKLQSAMMIKFWEGQNEVKIPKKRNKPLSLTASLPLQSDSKWRRSVWGPATLQGRNGC